MRNWIGPPAVILLLVTLLATYFDQPWQQVGSIVVLCVLLLLLPLGVYRWYSQRRHRGAVLLDCGPHFHRGLMHLGAWVCLGCSGLMLSLTMTARATGLMDVYPVFMLIYGLAMLAGSAGRLTFHDNGIWAYRMLIRWENITSCRWETAGIWKHSSLHLTYRNGLSDVLPKLLIIADDHVAGVEELLEMKVTSPVTTGENEVVVHEKSGA